METRKQTQAANDGLALANQEAMLYLLDFAARTASGATADLAVEHKAKLKTASDRVARETAYDASQAAHDPAAHDQAAHDPSKPHEGVAAEHPAAV